MLSLESFNPHKDLLQQRKLSPRVAHFSKTEQFPSLGRPDFETHPLPTGQAVLILLFWSWDIGSNGQLLINADSQALPA